MKNGLEVRGDVTAIFLRRNSGEVLETIIDTADLSLVQEFKGSWYAHWARNNKSFYAMGNLRVSENKRTSVQLHRWILHPSKGFMVDHINCNTLDNTRRNLRIVTNQHNCHNKNPSAIKGVRGVYWSEDHKRWRAVGSINYKHHHLGLFYDIKEAEKEVVNWRREHMPYSQMDREESLIWR